MAPASRNVACHNRHDSKVIRVSPTLAQCTAPKVYSHQVFFWVYRPNPTGRLDFGSRTTRSISPVGATQFSPGRKPWVHGPKFILIKCFSEPRRGDTALPLRPTKADCLRPLIKQRPNFTFFLGDPPALIRRFPKPAKLFGRNETAARIMIVHINVELRAAPHDRLAKFFPFR